MAEPIVIANRWLTATLKATGAVSAIVGTRVYDGTLPVPATYPLILFDYRGSVPAITHDGIWVMATLNYRVRGIVTEDSAAAVSGDLAAAIVTAIHRKGGAVTGGTVWSCVKVDDYERDEAVPEHSYRHLGGEFALIVS